jgi:hypothetical protein
VSIKIQYQDMVPHANSSENGRKGEIEDRDDDHSGGESIQSLKRIRQNGTATEFERNESIESCTHRYAFLHLL